MTPLCLRADCFDHFTPRSSYSHNRFLLVCLNTAWTNSRSGAIYCHKTDFDKHDVCDWHMVYSNSVISVNHVVAECFGFIVQKGSSKWHQNTAWLF